MSCVCVVTGGWAERAEEQEAHEDSAEVDERETEAQADVQPCGTTQAVSLHNLVYKTQHPQHPV